MRISAARKGQRITMDDVIFVLRYIRDRGPETIESIGDVRINAFHERLRQRPTVRDYQTIEANCLRDRGLTADEFDRLVFDWLIRGQDAQLRQTYNRAFGDDDITANPQWQELFAVSSRRSPMKGAKLTKPKSPSQRNRKVMQRRSFSDVLDAAEQLDSESQVELLAILRRRIAEKGRERVVADVREAQRDFAEGRYEEKTAADIVREALS